MVPPIRKQYVTIVLLSIISLVEKRHVVGAWMILEYGYRVYKLPLFDEYHVLPKKMGQGRLGRSKYDLSLRGNFFDVKARPKVKKTGRW